jgi:hypothetical protein
MEFCLMDVIEMYGCTNDVHILSKSRYVYVVIIVTIIFMCDIACGLFLMIQLL